MVGIIVVNLTNVRNTIPEVLVIIILLQQEVRVMKDLTVPGHGIWKVVT